MIEIYNTGETSELLREKYNPEGSSLRKAQLRMLDMLIYLDSVCKKIGVPYRLDSGNVIGALRHGGFIPWDDDVDVVVERKYLNKLSKYLTGHPHPQYVLQNKKTDSGYMGGWMVLRDIKSEYIQESDIHNMRKYRGFQVDIFPCDNGNLECLKVISMKLYSRFVYEKLGKQNKTASLYWNILFRLVFPIFRMFNVFGDRTVESYSYGVGFIESRVPCKFTKPYKPIVFEGITFMGPADPDGFCKSVYGNYMDLPPESERDHHQAKYIIYD